MNDSDTEFIAPEEIELTGNPDNASVLTPEANVHVVDKGTKHTNELEKNKKRKTPEENTRSHGNWMSPHSRENYLLEGGVSYQFDESVPAFDIFEQVINLDVLIELII